MAKAEKKLWHFGYPLTTALPYSGLYWRGLELGDLAIPFLIAKSIKCPTH
jgi:hypothetical protein